MHLHKWFSTYEAEAATHVNPLIYISNESSYAVEDKYRGKKDMVTNFYICKASYKLLTSVSGMPTRGIFFLNTSKYVVHQVSFSF